MDQQWIDGGSRMDQLSITDQIQCVTYPSQNNRTTGSARWKVRTKIKVHEHVKFDLQNG